MLGTAGLSAEPQTLKISQAHARTPEIIVYVDILDASGTPVQGISAASITATIGRYQTKIKTLKPFDKTTEGTAYIVLVDISRSLTKREFQQIRQSLSIWIEDLSEKDRMSIFSFGNKCEQRIDFSSNKGELKKILEEIEPSDDNTQLYSALDTAVQTMVQRRDTNLPTRRVVVVLSDGKDEGGGLKEEDIKAKIKEHHFPIYAIGYSRLRSPDKEKYLKVLNNFATISGGIYLQAKEDNLQDIYRTLRQAILEVYRLDLTCDNCEADGRYHPLVVNLTSGSLVLSNHMDVQLIPGVPEIEIKEQQKKLPLWVYLAGGLGIILLAAILLFFLMREKKPSPGEDKKPVTIEDDKPESISPESAAPPLPGKPGIKIRLVDIGGKDKKTEYEAELREKAVVGRSEDCDIVIKEDRKISRQHCELLYEDGNVLVRDLDSDNGTAVNDVFIQGRFRLGNNDTITLGDTELRILF